ncbi:MAG: FN3 associated domain-containing protein [Oligoflexales bacterium]
MKIIKPYRPFTLFLILALACKEESSRNEPTEVQTALVQEEITVAGTLSVTDEDGGAATIPENQKVELQDGAGQVVGQTIAGTDGSYEISVGSLSISEAANLLATNYTLNALIEETESGKVLGIREPIELNSDLIEQGRFEVGESVFRELAAIKGSVQFVNPDGSVNKKVSKLGVDVYLPGISFFAKTDSNGKFLLIYVPAGEYNLRVEKGAFFFEQSLSVEENKTVNLDEINVQTDTDAPMTVASKDSTDFKNPLCLRLESDEENAQIYFSTDGSNPSQSNTFLYPGENTTCGSEEECPICLENSTTLKFFAVDTVGNVEDLRINFYYYNERWADPTDTTAPSTSIKVDGEVVTADELYLTSTKTIGLESNESADIFYTLDGSNPSVDGLKYTAPFDLEQTTTLKVMARDYASNLETIKSKTLNFYNWQKVDYTGSPPAVSAYYNNNHWMIYDTSAKDIKLYCSNCSASNEETWSYKNGTWSQLGSQAITFQTTTLVHNQADGKNYLFIYPSGSGGSDFDAYQFNTLTNNWDTYSISGLPQPGNAPNSMNATYNSDLGKVILNYAESGTIKTYILDHSTGTFSISSQGAIAKTFYHIAHDAKQKKTLGYGRVPPTWAPTYIGASYTFDHGTQTWSEVITENNPDIEVLKYHDGLEKIIAFGASQTAHAETWVFDGEEWQELNPLSQPKSRTVGLMVYDPDRNTLVVYGGRDKFSQALSDMWEFRY